LAFALGAAVARAGAEVAGAEVAGAAGAGAEVEGAGAIVSIGAALLGIAGLDSGAGELCASAPAGTRTSAAAASARGSLFVIARLSS
jgi:hypothetical protein